MKTRTCIIRVPERGRHTGEKFIFRNRDSIESAISVIKNQVFKNSPLYEGNGIKFTAHTQNNFYYITEGNHNPTEDNFLK